MLKLRVASWGPGDAQFDYLYKVVYSFEAARPKIDIIWLQRYHGRLNYGILGIFLHLQIG